MADGINTISVKSSGGNGSFASTIWRDDADGFLEEIGICIYAQNADWEIEANKISTFEVDLLGVLMHEFGHVLGLDHSAGTVMEAAGLDGNNARHLFGDNIRGLRKKYSPHTFANLQGFWRRWAGTNWTNDTTIPTGPMYRPISGTVTTTKVVASSISETSSDVTPKYVNFQISNYPLSSSSVWNSRSQYYAGGFMYERPGLGSDGTTIVAAVPLYYDNVGQSCPGVRFWQTSNHFVSSSTYDLTDMCTLDAVSITWNPQRQIWVAVWLDLNRTTEENTDRMLFRTSTDGINWSSPQTIGRYSTAAPTISCQLGTFDQCLLTYTRASATTPTAVSRETSFSSSGTITLNSFTETSSFVQRAVSNSVNSTGIWTQSYSWTTNTDWRSKGWGKIYTQASNSIPISATSILVESAEHTGVLVGNQSRFNTYLFYSD